MINSPRVIPCLLLKQTGFVKTVRFADPSYLGDPINIVKLSIAVKVQVCI